MNEMPTNLDIVKEEIARDSFKHITELPGMTKVTHNEDDFITISSATTSVNIGPALHEMMGTIPAVEYGTHPSLFPWLLFLGLIL